MRLTAAVCLLCSLLGAAERKPASKAPEKKPEPKAFTAPEKKPEETKAAPRTVILQPPPVIVVGPSFKSAVAYGLVGGILQGIAQGVAERRAARFAAESAEQERRESIVPDTMSPVSISSKPSGAMVRFYGSPIGYTPVTMKLAPWRYSVTLSAPGYADATYDIDVQAATPAEFALDLTPAAGNNAQRDKQARPDDSVVTLQ